MEITGTTFTGCSLGQLFTCDPYYANVSLLLPMNGLNGSTTFTDFSPSPKIITTNGNTQISTAQAQWNGSSGYFDGNGDFLSLPTSNDFNFGSGDFTIEFWYLKAGTPQSYARIFQTVDGDIVTGVSIAHDLTTDNLGCFLSYYGTTQNFVATNIGTVSSSEWRHFAIVRDGTAMRFFQNGVQVTYSFSVGTASLYYSASQTTVVIGGQTSTSRSINGYLNDLRVTKGVARYTSNFTPPTAPFPTTGC